MTQHKAASLTKGLFARKGRASPASLLIAEMEGGAPEIRDLQPKHTPDAPSKLDLSGSAAAKKNRKAKEPAELPLLAFAESQVEGEAASGNTGQGDAVGGGAAPKAPDDPRPAASLLDSTARALRQANGRAPATSVLPAQVAAADEAAEEKQETQEVLEIETVSGDANVAAIEDAPREDSEEGPENEDSGGDGDVAVVEAPAEDAGASKVAQSGEAPATPLDIASVSAAPMGVTPVSVKPVSVTPAAARKLSAEAALSATVALRQAAAQRATPMPDPKAGPTPAARASVAMPAPPKTGGGTLPWRSAAVVALGVALGLGAYVAFSSDPAAPPVRSTADIVGTDSAGSIVAELPATEETATAAAPTAQDEAAAGTPPPAVALPEPSFDIIRIEPDGQSIVAGRAAPGSEWILLNNGEPIASVRADGNGEWVVLPDASLVPGANAFSLVPKAERGKVAIPAPAAAGKLSRQPAASEAPTAPRPAMPQPGADAGAAAAPAPATVLRAELAEDGAYELQVASVRQSAAAARERDRLAAAFPELLGALQLRVQEASVEGAGTFFRVRSGAIANLGAAREVCRRLDAAGQGCLVVRRPPPVKAPRSEIMEENLDTRAAAEQQARRP